MTLEKHGHYRLGGGAAPGITDIDRAVRIAASAAGVSLSAVFILLRVFW